MVYDPNAATLQQRLAIEYYTAGKVKEALNWAERARAAAPERRDVSLLVAGLMTSSKNYSKAEEVYKGLIKHDKDDSEAVLYLGAVYTELKNYPKAIESFSKLTKMPVFASKYLAHYYLARVYAEQSKHSAKKVMVELKKSIALKPDFFEAVGMLGHLMQQDEGAEKAFQFYADHQQKHGPSGKLAELLAQYYISKNQYDKAYEQQNKNSPHKIHGPNQKPIDRRGFDYFRVLIIHDVPSFPNTRGHCRNQ